MYLAFLGVFVLFLVMRAAKTNEQTNLNFIPNRETANTVNILAFFLLVIFPFTCRRVRLCCMHSFVTCFFFFF